MHMIERDKFGVIPRLFYIQITHSSQEQRIIAKYGKLKKSREKFKKLKPKVFFFVIMKYENLCFS